MCSARLKSTAQTGDCSGQPFNGNLSSDTYLSPEVPDFGPGSSTFSSPIPCYDVAVSADGCHLLLAAGQQGLLECDKCGAELSRWKPTEKTEQGWEERVTAVEVLQDSRVAVCLRWSECVALLKRNPASDDAWLEDRRITGLGISPGWLSGQADLIAVAEWWPRSDLSLLSLSSGQELSRQRREYYIGGMAVTAEALLTASDGRVKLDRRREVYVVDASSHDGQLLWRQEQGNPVTDICAAPSGRVLYMALCGSDRVTAARAEDGSLIKEVLTSSSHSIRKPRRLSTSSRAQGTVLAVLSSDQRMVTVYLVKLAQ